MKTFNFVGSEMSPKNCAVKPLVPLWCCFLLSSYGASAFCRPNGMFPHPSDCGKFFSCTPWGPVIMHCPAGLHFNPQLHICDWPNRADCMDKQHSTQKCPIYRHPTDCAKFYICAPPGHLLLHCPFGLLFNPLISVCDWPANVQCSTSEATTAPAQTDALTEEWKEETTHEPLLSETGASAENPSFTTDVQKFPTAVTEESKEETTAVPQTDVSNEATSAVTEKWTEETTHEPLLSATGASAENPNMTTDVEEFPTAVTEEPKEENFAELVWATNETTAVTDERTEETTQELLTATEAPTESWSLTTEIHEFSTTDEETERPKIETTGSSEAQTEISAWNHPPTEAEAALVTTEWDSSTEAASTAVDAEAATIEVDSPTTTARV